VKGLVEAGEGARPDAEAAVFPGERATYRELAERCRRAAQRLVGLGVAPGDRVGLLVPGCLEHTEVLLGAMWIGAVPVPLNSRFKTCELSFVLEHSEMRVLVTEPAAMPLVAKCEPQGCTVVLVGEGEDPAAAGEHVPAHRVEKLASRVRPGDPAILLYTSGTTANPKGVVHTHASLAAQGRNVVERLGLRPGDRFWAPLPMFHAGGIVTMLGALAARATFVHVGTFEPAAALHQLEAERATHAFPAFETVWLSVLDQPRFPEADLSALRIVINVGVPERLRAMQARLPGATQISCFGSTESCGFVCLGLEDDPLELRVTTSGTVMTGMEVRAVDPETGRDVAHGDVGEALYRGVTRFKVYFRDRAATQAAIDEDGWFHSGDLIRLDAEGRLSFVGRLKDMLKVGGENVSPAQIEDLLATHPAVQTVNVVAAPDARYGEVAAAFVELRPGAAADERELIDLCLGRIATFKVPRYVRFVDEWPMSGTKVQKHRLRERIARELREAGITEAPRVSSRRQ